MSSLIKSRDATARRMVRAFPAPRFESPPTPRPEVVGESARLALEAELETLRLQLEARDVEIDALQEAVDRAREEGRNQGRREAIADAEAAQDVATAALRSGIETALDELRSALDQLERLAPAMVERCLARMMDDPAERVSLLSALVSRQLADLRDETVLGIEVSGVDFPDRQALADWVATVGGSGLSVTASDTMAAGGCRLRLKLGVVEAGLDQQWSVLRSLLEDLAGPERL